MRREKKKSSTVTGNMWQMEDGSQIVNDVIVV